MNSFGLVGFYGFIYVGDVLFYLDSNLYVAFHLYIINCLSARKRFVDNFSSQTYAL